MITVERHVEVDRPVHTVWTYLADFTHTEQWDPGTVTTTRTDAGPLALGARFHNVSTYRGRKTHLDYVVKRFDVDEHLTFTGSNKTVIATDDMGFASSPFGGTLLTYRAYFTFRGLARLAEPVLRRGFDTIADDTAEQLRATLAALPA